MDDHDLAWAAGFFDGDGWAARVKHRRSTRPMAQINQAGQDGVPEVLTRFRDLVGAGRVLGPKIEEGRRPLYRWVASRRGDVTRTGELIGPWLCRQKRAQFTRALGITMPTRRSDLMVPWSGGFFDAEGWTTLGDHRSHAGYKLIEVGAGQSGKGAEPPEELQRILAAVPVGRIYGPYEQDGANDPVYKWRTSAVDEVHLAIHLLQPWIGHVKRHQARGALEVIDGQAALPRGRVDWGSHKTHCIHGHEYATARLRDYVSRGGTRRRENKQCLACTREQARVRRIVSKHKTGGR